MLEYKKFNHDGSLEFDCPAAGDYGVNFIENTAFAREAEEQKGMQDSMLTGATSSFARKYCLNGLFLIDDTKDADATHDFGKGDKKDNKEELKTTETGSTEKPVGTRFRRGAK